MYRGGLGETALHVTAATGELQALLVLLEVRADPDAEDSFRETPFLYAALSSKADIVRALLSAGASHSAASSLGQTPLDVARTNAAVF